MQTHYLKFADRAAHDAALQAAGWWADGERAIPTGTTWTPVKVPERDAAGKVIGARAGYHVNVLTPAELPSAILAAAEIQTPATPAARFAS